MSWLTQNDVQQFGSDLIDVTQRAALHAVGPQIESLAQENARLQHWLGVEARHRMDAAVEKAVPNFREIDQDPRWHNWLLSSDPLSGRQRQQLLDDAIRSGAVNRVISFFRQFENQAASQSSYYGAGASSGAVYTRPQIQQLYAAHRKGAYVGREAEWARIDADIIRAAAEGRIQAPAYITK